MITAAPSPSADLAAACGNAAEVALVLAQAFLILALIVAVAETVLTLWAKLQAARKGPQVAGDARELAANVDPIKLLDALKGLLETLKTLPAWIAIFLAGVLLFWVAGELASDRCAPAGLAPVAPPAAGEPTPSSPVTNEAAPDE